MEGFEGFSLQGSAVRLPQIAGLKSGMNPNRNHLSMNNNQQLMLQSRPESHDSYQSEKIPSSLSISMDDRRISTSQMYQKPKISKGNPVTMKRAKVWTVEVENAYRFQLAGFADESEYLSKYPQPGIYWGKSMTRI